MGDRGDNIYMIDTSVPRRLPHLPEFNFSLDSKKDDENNNDEDVGGLTPKSPDDYKLYETISLQSRTGSERMFQKTGVIPSAPELSSDFRVRSVSDYEYCQTEKSPSYLELEGFDYP